MSDKAQHFTSSHIIHNPLAEVVSDNINLLGILDLVVVLGKAVYFCGLLRPNVTLPGFIYSLKVDSIWCII